MYWPTKEAEFPDKDAPIWRYLNFTKFVDMLHRQSLFFCRTDCFTDRFEGTWGTASRKLIEDSLRQSAEKGINVIGGVEYQKDAHKNVSAHIRRLTAVNCWYQSPHESDAMWKLYVVAHQGVAIRSTPQRLIDSFGDDRQVLMHVGMVNYIDYDNEAMPHGNYLTPLLYKRKNFEHERELRAVACKAEIVETENSASIKTLQEEFARPGENISADISSLVAAISLPPGAPTYMTTLVESIVDKYGFDIPIERSRLDDEPV